MTDSFRLHELVWETFAWLTTIKSNVEKIPHDFCLSVCYFYLILITIMDECSTFEVI